VTFERLGGLDQGFVEADLKNTEDESKVLSALNKIFPASNFEGKGDKIVGEVSLSSFKDLVEKEKIRAAIEALLDENLSGEKSYIDLNKLAALVGRVGIDEGSPIGKIRLYVSWKKA